MEVPSYINELKNDLSRKNSGEFSETSRVFISSNSAVSYKKNSIDNNEEDLNSRLGNFLLKIKKN